MVKISHATPENSVDILALQKPAYQSEAVLYNDWPIPPLTQTIESLRQEFPNLVILKATVGGRIVGSVRAKIAGETCAVGRLIVHPEFQGKGIGSRLLQTIEHSCNNVAKFELFTGSKSENNIRLYQHAGYRITRTQLLSPTISIIFLEKAANATL